MPGLLPAYRPDFPTSFVAHCHQIGTRRRSSTSFGNAPAWCSCCTSSRSFPMLRQPLRWDCTLTLSATGGSAGSGGTSPWTMSRDGGVNPVFPPLDHALVKAVACELVAETKQPLSRQSLADVTTGAQHTLAKPISRSTVWRILATDAIKPWRYKYWIFPRDPHFAEKAGPILDLYAGTWQGQPLGPKDPILSADEKTSIQARILLVHTPVHASWLNQVEIYFSIIQRKVLTPKTVPIWRQSGSGWSSTKSYPTNAQRLFNGSLTEPN
jgi:hypothetical protein